MTAASISTGSIAAIAGQKIPDLAHRFGTPVYVYDAAIIAQRLSELSTFDVVRYAQKACSNIAILDLVRRHGALVDCVSAGEIHRAITAGFKHHQAQHPPEMVYTADIFDHEALDLVVQHGIHVNCGSPDMIDQYGEARGTNSPAGITLRINPGFGHGHSQKVNTGGAQSKHGIWHEQLEACIERAGKYNLSIAGLHMHIGSGTDLAHLSQVCGAMERAALGVGSSITSISAGGGLPVPYRVEQELVDIDAYYKLWNATRHRLSNQFGHEISLEIEPGRYLVAESGYLISEIRAVKTAGENTFYLLDAGFNNLARPILYGAYHPMAICPQNGDLGPAGARANRDVIVGGPLCESGDIFTQDEGGFVSHRSLPKAKVGDFLVIGCAGAYSYAMASNYNSKPLVAEVLIENGRTNLIRRRQTLADLIEGESIPSLA
ncbi:MAG TPA: diaminopimelate decarboxylase [Lacipirellulaceae bacterium]|nr:diaminopimelate decarboxylase [Lacipirellulaceae bacterium]